MLDGKREPCEISFADFDEVLFKLVVAPGAENVLTLHVHLPCWDVLAKNGATEVLDTLYAAASNHSID